MDSILCVICYAGATALPDQVIACPRCGQFSIKPAAAAKWKALAPSDTQRAIASGWLRENQNLELDEARMDWLAQLRAPSVVDRAMKLLNEIARRQANIGDSVTIEWHGSDILTWLGITSSASYKEVMYLADELLVKTYHYIESKHQTMAINHYRLTPQGHQYLQEGDRNRPSNMAFCAMWFDADMKTVYTDAIAQAIHNAGFDPQRTDDIEHADRIDDQIFAMIKKARFVVADFTGHRGGVYFEAGFAQGMGLPVIWTCRADQVNELHFDIRQYNCLEWQADDLTGFAKRLTTRIEAVVGRGLYQ